MQSLEHVGPGVVIPLPAEMTMKHLMLVVAEDGPVRARRSPAG
jgi:hypothetical protein